ncbi:alpha-xylosidase [Actinoplanes sp. SE50]|uniref:TIM-barrel domain-containing protein n=1 Tax=unclassified Actinoplanes TaxID=2626549 RepID=UPI00023ED471|nr:MULTISPECIES: TIM-barrel domain-containing protein [unclassified Actinoplanes]AEV85609.1 glycoside hydrolase family 31 [Actinoplanes sp. SE50/110]ATO84002.1 alpha-xylosidase [Actinoplanes sp. SE50]SLM01412.1 alpha-xylosidase [Actinoplanes sp. SE50/110]
MPLRSVAVLAATILSLPGALPAHAAAAAAPTTITVGNARFQVLSPTLIRTEYSADGRFTDAATFTVVGRGAFPRAATVVRRSLADGWLTVDTGAATLRYLVGSGPFSQDNLVVRLKSGQQQVDAAPWAGPSCALGVLCEAETLRAPATATDHGGYTGTGFAAGFGAVGDGLAFTTAATTAGTYQLDLRYANAQGADGQNTTRTLSVIVDNGAAQRVTLPPTGSWDTWQVATAAITLGAGHHQIAIAHTAADSGQVNIDSVAIVRPGDAYPPVPTATASPCAYGSLCEADTGVLTGGAKHAADHNGYSGAGFLAGLEHAGAGAAYTITGIPAAGDYTVQLRYANFEAGSQPVQSRTVTVNGTSATLPATSGWDYWRTVAIPVRLKAGTDTVTLGCPTDASCNINVDTIAVAATGTPLKAPHAPLGGYRRGLDGVDGGALTAAGLLYADGWALLDDSASARAVPEQDGYVFAYGKDFARGLRELGTLTGPTALLPEWAYGVWYSEYYDRTAADFQQRIVPRFRSEGVPLDVLIVDTDFKSPDTWNGWEIDPAKFPDPQGFLDWVHGQGLHLSYNIHPSIKDTDPKYAQAQAIAQNKIKNGVFDWGDPDQLAAYLWLHNDLKQDFAWLDWCCDGSYSSKAGVTPDSWINQQYAGRYGFAFSRGYGSLQSGGYSNPAAVPTGPWAEKRTTLHFTGDAISDWQTLRFEVGYTPGESAATGLAAVSHDIGGHTGGLQQPGSEPGSTRLPDDLYARWVQLGTFQPIDRLHSNHSDRLPWQYGPDAAASAKKFLQLREQLRPYTYAAAQTANRTGMPINRALYLAYPDSAEAYAYAGSEYLFGSDYLVAPVTTAGTTATTTVWFPPGNTWTDYFTHQTYAGGTTAQITTTLSTMPVFTRG